MKGDESLLDLTACVQSESWYNKQKSGTNGGITPRCNMCNIMHNMVAISYRHPSRVNTETEQKEHTSQPFGSPLSPSSVFCFSGAVLAKQQQSGHASRQSASTLTFSNPPPGTATLEVLQTCTCLWGFIRARPHAKPRRHGSVCVEGELSCSDRTVGHYFCSILNVIFLKLFNELAFFLALCVAYFVKPLNIQFTRIHCRKKHNHIFFPDTWLKGSLFSLFACVQGSGWRLTRSCKGLTLIHSSTVGGDNTPRSVKTASARQWRRNSC